MISSFRKKTRQSSNDEPMDDTPAPPAQPQQPSRTRRDLFLPKDISELTEALPPTCRFNFPNQARGDLSKMLLEVRPSTESLWSGGVFKFMVDIPDEYKFQPPKVRCQTPIYHPNINETGEVCLSILRVAYDNQGWMPTRSLKEVVLGLDQLFTDLLNFDDPLNTQAAEHFLRDPRSFQTRVREYINRHCGGRR